MNGPGFIATGLSPLVIELHSIYTSFDLKVTEEKNFCRDFLNSIIRQICAGFVETAYTRMKVEGDSLLYTASYETRLSYIKSMIMLKKYLK